MRKLLSVLLAIVMLVLPTMSLAASPNEVMSLAAGRTTYTDVTFTPGNLPLNDTYATAAGDLLSALSLNFKRAGNEGEVSGLSVNLSGTKVLTADVQVKDGTLYLATSMLDHPVVFTMDELQTLVSAYTEEMSAQADTNFTDFSNLESLLTSATANFSFDTEKAAEVMERIASTVTTEAVTEQSKDHDAAATKTTFAITAEDCKDALSVFLNAVYTNESMMAFLRELNATYSFGDQEVTEEEFFTKAPEKVGEALSHYDDLQVTMMQNEAGETVHVEVSAEPKNGDADVMPIEITYNRLGAVDGVGHFAGCTLTNTNSAGEKEQMVFSIDWLSDTEKAVSFAAALTLVQADGTLYELFSFTADGTKDYGDTEASSDVTYTAAVSNDGTDASRMSLSARVQQSASFDGKDAAAIKTVSLYLNGNSNDPMVTMQVEKTTGDAAADIDASDATHPFTMTEDELDTYMTDVQNSVTTNLIVFMQNLPESVLKLLAGSSEE